MAKSCFILPCVLPCTFLLPAIIATYSPSLKKKKCLPCFSCLSGLAQVGLGSRRGCWGGEQEWSVGEWGVGQGSAMVPSSYQQRTFCSHSLMLLSFTCVSWGVKLRLEGNVSGPSNPERLPPRISLRTESSVAAEVRGYQSYFLLPWAVRQGRNL